MWYWNPLGAMGLAVGTLGVILALVVLFSRPGRLQNRLLALALFIEAPNMALGNGIVYLTDDVGIAYAAQAVNYLMNGLLLPAYLAFLSTLPTPITRWLRSRWAVGGLVALSLAYVVFFFARTDALLAGMAPTDYARLESVHGPLTQELIVYPLMAVAAFGLAVTLFYWRGAPRGTALRKEGAIYAAAFGVRDATTLVYTSLAFLVGARVGTLYACLAVGFALYYVLLAYGILKHQLFEIDLRIKWTIRRGTIAAAFVGAFFVVSEVAQVFFAGLIGPILGIVAAGLLAFVLAPLQRAADRLAERAMPGVHDTDEYRLVRRREVYLATVEGALVDGSISDRERDMLARLQDQLGLTGTEARDLERRALASRPPNS